MQHDHSDTHIFSLYAHGSVNFASAQISKFIKIEHQDLVHRMSKVLRLQVGERVILFDCDTHATVQIHEILKREIIVKIESIEHYIAGAPSITFLLPLLKKEALQDAVYSLCELGVTNIQLVATKKSRASLFGEKEFERLQQTIIAAAEQSKNYAFPTLLAPQPLTESFLQSFRDAHKFVFDVDGVSLRTVVHDQKSKVLLIGPEGGLTHDEQRMMQAAGFQSCALTTTILRAVQAVVVSASFFRLK